MKPVAKYNVFKGVSTLLTLGTPIITLCSCGDFFVHRSDTAVSASGVFVLLILAILFKDKLMERFKMPPAFVICLIAFILICMIESILFPIKMVCIVTMITSGVDEITFKRFYKDIEQTLPTEYSKYKHIGFIFTTSKKLIGEKDVK